MEKNKSFIWIDLGMPEISIEGCTSIVEIELRRPPEPGFTG
jgi:hypothetical protein